MIMMHIASIGLHFPFYWTVKLVCHGAYQVRGRRPRFTKLSKRWLWPVFCGVQVQLCVRGESGCGAEGANAHLSAVCGFSTVDIFKDNPKEKTIHLWWDRGVVNVT
jgi:hypothetical protein